jgi:hypothetical protein
VINAADKFKSIFYAHDIKIQNPIAADFTRFEEQHFDYVIPFGNCPAPPGPSYSFPAGFKGEFGNLYTFTFSAKATIYTSRINNQASVPYLAILENFTGTYIGNESEIRIGSGRKQDTVPEFLEKWFPGIMAQRVLPEKYHIFDRGTLGFAITTHFKDFKVKAPWVGGTRRKRSTSKPTTRSKTSKRRSTSRPTSRTRTRTRSRSRSKSNA